MARFEFYKDDEGRDAESWTVTGVAPDGAPSHYDIQDSLRKDFPVVTFDSEAGTFFAYSPDRFVAINLTARLNQMFPETPLTAQVALTKAEIGFLWGLIQAEGSLTIEAAHARAQLTAAADEIIRAENEAR